MNETLLSAPFELAGNFGGFIFTDAGKRRMLLHQGEHSCLLKVPRILRRRIIGKFRPGERIRVAGVEEQDPSTGLFKRVVSQVLPEAVPDTPGAGAASPPGPATGVVACPIRVCSKKNCWRNGGRELWHTLDRELHANGLAGQIDLRQVGCLDRCKQAPNADWGDHEYARCSPGDAPAILARAAGK